MNPAAFLAAGTLICVAVFLVAASTAELDPVKPFWPTIGHRGDLLLSLLALVCAFAAGWLV
jgi:hypothetical protein